MLCIHPYFVMLREVAASIVTSVWILRLTLRFAQDDGRGVLAQDDAGERRAQDDERLLRAA